MLPGFAGQEPVCMRCRNRAIRQQGIGEGLWPGGGEGIAWVCDACGHIGAPLLLETAQDAEAPVEAAWEEEYRAADARLTQEARPTRSERERRSRARGTRILAWVFFIVAAIFLLPPAIMMTQALQVPHWIAVPGAIAGVLLQTWLFLGVGIVLLVMARRKIDRAAEIENEDAGGTAAEA